MDIERLSTNSEWERYGYLDTQLINQTRLSHPPPKKNVLITGPRNSSRKMANLVSVKLVMRLEKCENE